MPYKTHKQYRPPHYDYGAMGDYFITVCTKNRVPYFGKIIHEKEMAIMELSPIALFLQNCIIALPENYTLISLGETIIMPNHIHLVITILEKSQTIQKPPSILQASTSNHKGLTPLLPGSISSIINHLKGGVKKWCNVNEFSQFAWQQRFHDHIIRSSTSFNRINNYVANNVYSWQEDENNQNSKNFKKKIRL